MNRMIREHSRNNIIACHDADELEFLSDEIIEIAEGKIQPKKDKKSNKQ